MSDDSMNTTPLVAGPALALTVAYDGADFSGFARQPSQRTVQGELEQALSIALRRPIEIVGAGRTDTGVHALGQVVSFPHDDIDLDERALLRSLNALVGDGISVREIRRARDGFSARFDAIRREYRYRIVAGPVPPLFLRQVAWWTPRPLDVDAVREGAAHLVGEHDFKSFCLTESAEGKRTSRRVDSVEVFRGGAPGRALPDGACRGQRVPALDGARRGGHARRGGGGEARAGVGRRGAYGVRSKCCRSDRARPGSDVLARGLPRGCLVVGCDRRSRQAGYTRRRVLVDASVTRGYYGWVRFSSPVKVRTEHVVLYS